MRLIIATLAALVLTAQAHAGLVGYTFQVSGDYNLPYFTYTNLSDTGAKLSEAKITIGDRSFNFDNALYEGFKSATATSFSTAPAGSFTQYGPDNIGSGTSVRSDAVRFALAPTYQLSRNASFRWRSDLDRDTGDTTVDFRRILFDRGGTSSSDNALVWVKFSDGTILQGLLPDYSTTVTSYTITQTVSKPAATLLSEPVAVPLPPAALLSLTGLACAGVACVRRIRP